MSLVSTAMSFYIGKVIRRRQRAWLDAIQSRLNFTSEVLGSLKSVKMLGLIDKMGDMIQGMRNKELTVSRKFRRIQALNVALINIPAILGQFCTFAAYAIVAKIRGTGNLSVTQAIAALALIQLVVNPLSDLLGSIPLTYQALGCLDRIQAFLVLDPRKEKRILDSRHSSPASAVRPSLQQMMGGHELSQLKGSPAAKNADPFADGTSAAISLTECTFGWTSSSTDLHLPVSLEIPFAADGFLAILVGPVGCGKSTLLKALIGETTVLRGAMIVNATSIGFCDQTSWITNGSIRDNITAESGGFDAEWYLKVLDACALQPDLDQLSLGDATVVGSKGVKLSGGQKQRIVCIPSHDATERSRPKGTLLTLTRARRPSHVLCMLASVS
jgi:ATP-binding cassette subfamily C (CFTR/MRP) protein 1